jgi:diketogulonate reductase-like aldo/keto reductase
MTAQIGAALRKAMAALEISRDDLFITSKLAHDHHQPRDVEVAYTRTVEDLGVGPLDLYLVSGDQANRQWPEGRAPTAYVVARTPRRASVPTPRKQR